MNLDKLKAAIENCDDQIAYHTQELVRLGKLVQSYSESKVKSQTDNLKVHAADNLDWMVWMEQTVQQAKEAKAKLDQYHQTKRTLQHVLGL